MLLYEEGKNLPLFMYIIDVETEYENFYLKKN